MFLFFCTIQQFHSQEDGVVALALPVRNSLRFNRYVVNPTFSFVRESNRFASFSNKREWVQFDDAPQTYLFSYSGRFRENIGAGIGVFQQNYGVFSTFGGVANFAYNVVLNRDSNLTFGLNAGFYKSGISDGRVVTNVPDPSLNNIPSNSVITINPGINYGTGFFDFGLSVNNLVSYNLTNSKMIEENPEQSVQPHIMYTGYMNSGGFFDESKFSTLIRSEFKKDETVLSGMVMLTVPKGIWAQAGYNTKFGVAGGIGLNITKNIAFEYNYEKAAGGFSEFGSSHEITLAYRFKNETRFSYSDDDEETALFTPNKRNANIAKRKANTSSDAEFRANRIAKAKLDEERKAQLAAEAQKKEDADAKLKLEAQAKADEIAKAKSEEEARAKAENEAKINLADQQLEAEKETQLAEAKRKAEKEARAKLEVNRLKAQRKAEAEAAKLKAEQEAKARLEAQRKAEEEARLEAEAEAEQKIEEAKRLKAEQEAQEKERVGAEAKARLEAERINAEQEAKAIAEAKQKEAEAKVAPEAVDAESKSMNRLAKETEVREKEQQELLSKLSERIAIKQQDLDDLKEENDLSEQGIYQQPKAFKSVSAENAVIEKLKDDIDKAIKDQEAKLIELEAVYITRKKKVKSKTDPVNTFYLKEIERLKSEQLKIKNYKKELLANLEDIKVKTEVERRRRIKRAAYDNERDRYEKDRAALERIKRFADESDKPLSEDDFDFGEEQNDNIKIVKNILNAEPGYYLVVAVHSDVEKRDEFLTKAISLGQKDIDFFFDVKTNKYYIYHKKFNTINEAKQAIQSNGKQPYDKNTALVKIEN